MRSSYEVNDTYSAPNFVHFARELYAKLGISKDAPHGEDLRTFGDFRLAGDRARRVLREALQPHREYNDRKLDPTVGKLLAEAYDEIIHRFIARVAKFDPKPPEPTVRSAERRQAAVHDAGDAFDRAPARRTDPMRQLRQETLAALNADTQIMEGVFPRALHGFLNLDNPAERPKPGVMRDVPATWLPQLTEAQAGRLQRMLVETGDFLLQTFSQQLDAFFQGTTLRFVRDERRRALVVSDIQEHPETRAQILRWLERDRSNMTHSNEPVAQQSPMLQRHVLDQLMKPNLQRIIEEHFGRRNVPVEKRKLVDIAIGAGELPSALRHHFGKMRGYEQNQALVDRLKAEPIENLKVVHGGLTDILANPTYHVHSVDTILLTQGLHAAEQRIDHQALTWAHTHLSQNGIAILAFPDTEPLHASTGQIRSDFGVRSSSFSFAECQRYCVEHGIAMRSISPTLYIKAQTPEGKEALENMLLPMLPRNTSGNDRQWEAFFQAIDDHDGVLKHRLKIAVAYPAQDIAPEIATPRRIHLPFAASSDRHGAPPRPPVARSAQPRATAPEALVPLRQPLFDLPPREILAFVSDVNAITWGDEASERAVLGPIGVSWNTFRRLRQHLHDYEVAADVLKHITQHGTVSPTARIEARQLEIIVKALRQRFTKDDDFIDYLKSVGLYMRYYHKFGVPEHRRRRRRSVRTPVSEPALRRHAAPTPLPRQHRAQDVREGALGLPIEDRLLLRARQRAIDDLLGNGKIRDRALQLRGKLIAALTESTCN